MPVGDSRSTHRSFAVQGDREPEKGRRGRMANAEVDDDEKPDEGKKSQMARFEESLASCTSLPQVALASVLPAAVRHRIASSRRVGGERESGQARG